MTQRTNCVSVFLASCLLVCLPVLAVSQTLELPAPGEILSGLTRDRPRILAGPQDFQRVSGLIKTDDRARAWYQAVKKRGERMLAEPATSYDIPDGIRLLRQSRNTLERALTLGLLYRLEGDRKYRDRIWKDLAAAAEFKDWNPSHFLDVGEMTCAFAVAYDWLYEAWSEEQRRVIREAMVRHGLETALRAYKAEKPPWWVRAENNWNQVCNGGIAVGAIAIAQERPKLAAEVLHHALSNLPRAVESFAPDGACVEGPGYWGYATRYFIYLLATLDIAFDNDFGLSDLPGVDRQGDFPVLLRSPTDRTFNFADCGERTPLDAGLLWLAQRFGRRDWAEYQASLTSGTAADLLWYRPEILSAGSQAVPLDRHFRKIDVAVMRSAWGDPDAWYLACKAGDNRFNHGHLDIGTFVLEAKGERWASDLGKDNYNMPGYWSRGRKGRRWTYYRMRAQGQNTLVIAPGDYPDQIATAAGRVLAFESTERRAMMTIDMTPAYADWAKRVNRTFRLDRPQDGSPSVTIRDELDLLKPADTYWLMHTRAEVAVENDGRQARLTLNGKTLFAHLIEPAGAGFEILSASPLPGTPDPKQQAKNDAYRRLAIRLRGVTSTAIEVRFSERGRESFLGRKKTPDPFVSPVSVTDDGAWCWFADPRAVYHADKRKRTYVGWVNRAGDIMIAAYDHDTGAIERATIHTALNKDDHANPSIVIRPDGRLMVFYSGHSRPTMPMRVVVSKRPEDISQWNAPLEITTNTPGRSSFCYPNPVQLSAEDDRLYLFWRGGNWKPNFSTSDDGVNWTSARTFVEGRTGDRNNRTYTKYATNGRDRIDVAFTTGHPRNEPHNSIYYASYKNGAFHRADGSKIRDFDDSGLTYAEAELIYDAKTNGVRAWIWDIAIDPDDRPVIVYAACPSESDHRYRYARWDGSAWVDNEICEAGGWFPQTPEGKREREPHYSGGVVLDHGDPSIVYLSRQRDGVFEIERWTTSDNGRSWFSVPITRDSPVNNVRPFVARNHPADHSGLFWMRGEYIHYVNFATGIMMDPLAARLAYQQDFSSPGSLSDLRFSDPTAWRLAKIEGNQCLELFAASKYKPPHRSPMGIALIGERQFGDFVLELDLMQSGREYGHRDMCIFFGVQDPAHYYYAHIGTTADATSHQIHIVNGAARSPITKSRTKGVDWGSDVWHHVRVERTGPLIRVFFDDMSDPILTGEDDTFGAGYVGFGSFDDTGRIDNIKLWSDDARTMATAIFAPLDK